MENVKEWASFQAQLEKLVERGYIVDDTHFCIDTLKRVNYYRLFVEISDVINRVFN